VKLADVALPVPVPRAFTYEVPSALEGVAPGARVVCPFGARAITGVVLAVREGEPPEKVRPIAKVLPISLPADLTSFLVELSQYYFAPIGEVFRLAMPPLDRETAESTIRAKSDTLGLFGDEEAKGLSAKKIQWAEPTAGTEEPSKLSAQARAVLAHLRAHGGYPVARLVEKWGNARAAIEKLSELGLVRVTTRDKEPDPFFDTTVPRDVPPVLNPAQEEATRAICAAVTAGDPRTFLLHGVTGSGKTEVYMRAIDAAKARGVGVIVLVPEISLTPQLVSRYRARFGDGVCVLHSALTARERYTMWSRLRAGEVDVAIGARSALFAPVKDLGLIVVDEEHDSSFKQEEGVRYHARDMAILRAFRRGGVCVLGSATPSLETVHLARTGKADKLVLAARARAQEMPAVEIVDMRRTGAGPTGDKKLTIPLHRAIEKTLEKKEQIILFLNRRGFSPSVRCHACGELVVCPNCSVALTFHKGRARVLRCHYCDHEEPLLERCAKCKAPALELEGLGTEKLEETLAAAFPEAKVARLDRDVASGKAIERVIERVRSREVDVLVGTQMVTKGHDLPFVTLVGVINADAALSIPDFRAAERAFQLLVQVAGRAGRGDAPGRVVVQTYDPSHHALVFALQHDTEGFVERELRDRRELGYPPYSRMALVRIDAVDEEVAKGAAESVAATVRRATRGEVDVLGPAPAPIARVRGRFRFRVMLRAPDRKKLRPGLVAAAHVLEALPRNVRGVLDVDPVQLL